MRRSELLERVRSVLLPALANLGFDLVEVALVVSHGRRTLQVFIDKENGVNLDDCARASKAISPALDEGGFFRDGYYLEVSSPGAERKLRSRQDFERFVGRLALVRLREGRNGRTEVKGEIESFQDDMLALRPEGEALIAIPFETISSANLCL
ncbi:MAG: ribosome maturation factor RimP [Candidatus Eisenbacteria bacterium]